MAKFPGAYGCQLLDPLGEPGSDMLGVLRAKFHPSCQCCFGVPCRLLARPSRLVRRPWAVLGMLTVPLLRRPLLPVSDLRQWRLISAVLLLRVSALWWLITALRRLLGISALRRLFLISALRSPRGLRHAFSLARDLAVPTGFGVAYPAFEFPDGSTQSLVRIDAVRLAAGDQRQYRIAQISELDLLGRQVHGYPPGPGPANDLVGPGQG